jgi:nucleoside-diphosphate-sugar epimerase
VRALVTGASGFIGGRLCALLAREEWDVSALVRRPGSEPPGTTAVVAELGNEADLRAAVAGERPDVVFHLAAEIATARDEARLREVNVDGTRRLARACLDAGAPRLVFASTVVTGDAGGRVLTEDEPLPVETPYGRSKQEGERLVLGSGLPAVVVRPSHVYGPGGWFAEEIVARVRAPGRFAVVGRGENLWDVVHVDDVCSALLAAGTADAAVGGVFHCADDEPIAYRDFMGLTAEALGVGRPRSIPVAVARLAAGRNAVAAVVRSARSSNAKLKRELGWAPRYPSAREGVPAAVAELGQRRAR